MVSNLIEAILFGLDSLAESLFGRRLPRHPLIQALVAMGILLALAIALVVWRNWGQLLGAPPN